MTLPSPDLEKEALIHDLRRAMDGRDAEMNARRKAEAEVADLKQAVIAFAAPWAVQWAKEHELPLGHLHPEHYDLLERCGARMVDFRRAEVV